MSIPLFQELGLSPNEARIYEVLITYGGSGVSTIAVRSKIHRSNAYDALRRLEEKGLVYEVAGQSEVIYEPVDPVKFRELLTEKMEKFDAELPQITKYFLASRTPERAYVYKGIEGMKNYMRLMLKTGEDVHTIGGKCAWLDPKFELFTASFMRELGKKKMQKLSLFDAAVKEECPTSMLQKVSTKHKFLPAGYDTHSSVDIFGEYVVTFTGAGIRSLGDDMTLFVLASRDLANDFRTWWKMLWKLIPCTPE